MSGGFLVAVGSAGMAMAPGMSSSQNLVLVNLEAAQPGGTIVHVGSEDEKEILTFVPTKAYQSLALSSPELQDGETYVVYVGGSATGSVTDSLYADASYSPGTEVARFTISSVVTAAGAAGGGFFGGAGVRGGRGGGQPPQPQQP
jgi:energy-converting hydrogenase Eha subunit E